LSSINCKISPMGISHVSYKKMSFTPRVTCPENDSLTAPLEIPVKRRRSSTDRLFARRLMQVHWDLSVSAVTNCATKADYTCTIPRHLQAVRGTIAAVSGNARIQHEVRLTDRTRRRTGCRSGRASEQGERERMEK